MNKHTQFALLSLVITAVLLASCVTPGGPGAVSTPAGTPTPGIPPRDVPFTTTELRYALVDAFGGIFYCDPDEHPIPVGDEDQRALEWFAQAGANSEEVQTIVRVLKLGDAHKLSPEQQLAVYREHKKLAAVPLEPSGDGYTFTLRTLDAMAVTGTINRFGKIEVVKKQPTINTCPICLSGSTRIATPSGEIAVRDLRAGMAVWTRDVTGKRVAAVIVRAVRVAVSAQHQLVRVQLDDGRALLASPGHPTADGRRLGDLLAGDALDGARVVSAERVAYDEGATYDILPSGATGTYWANGILIGSTLAMPAAPRSVP